MTLDAKTVALSTIATWPITDRSNMDAVNMAEVARTALDVTVDGEAAERQRWEDHVRDERASRDAVLVDRSDAVNLARNVLDSRLSNALTERGVRILAEAVMNMDAALSAPTSGQTGA